MTCATVCARVSTIGVPGVGPASAGLISGAGRSRAPAGVLRRPTGGLDGGRPQHPPGAAGRGHVDGGQGGEARRPVVGQVPLLPWDAGDGAARCVGLPAMGISVPHVDAVGAAGGEGADGTGALGGLAGVPEGHRATGPQGQARTPRRGGCCKSCMACTSPCCRPATRRRSKGSRAETLPPRCVA